MRWQDLLRVVFLDDSLAIRVNFWLEVVRLGILWRQVFLVASFKTGGKWLVIGV